MVEPQHIRVLDLSSNSIVTIGDGLDGLLGLTALRLEDNRIADAGEVRALLPLNGLRRLSLHGNPFIDAMGVKDYRRFLACALPALKTLDTAAFTPRERRSAEAYKASQPGARAFRRLLAQRGDA